MTIATTETQIMLATIVGFVAIFVAFAPIIGVTLHYLGKQRQDHDDTSIITFIFAVMIFQTLASVVFYFVLQVFEFVTKIDGLIIFGATGVFQLFWNMPVIYTTPTTEAFSTVVVLVRETLKTINAFIPAAVALVGIAVGYWTSQSKIDRRDNHGNIDYFGYGVRMVLGVFFVSVAYIGWSNLASHTLQMPLAGDNSGAIVTLHEAAAAWWREGVGIIPAKK